MTTEHGINVQAAIIAFAVFLVTASAATVDLEYLLDLDDYENFLTHPLVTYSSATPWSAISLRAAWSLMWQPVLGVVEPAIALLRAALVMVWPNAMSGVGGARVTYLIGCAIHASNAAQLSLLLAEVGNIGLLFEAPSSPNGAATTSVAVNMAAATQATREAGPSRCAITAATLAWAMHPLRGEVLGWLSCQGYLFATAFALLSVRASVSSLSGGSGSSSSFGHWRGFIWFALACGCKAVAVTLPCVHVLLHTLHTLQKSTQRNQASLASLVHAGLRAVCWHWPHALIAAAMIKFTLDVNSSHASTPSEEDAVSATAADGGVRADSGLFWAPAELSGAGLAYKAICSLVFYALKHLHPFDLRVLYLTPRAALGVKSPLDAFSGDVLSIDISGSRSNSSSNGVDETDRYSIAPDQILINMETGISDAALIVVCCLTVALSCGAWLLPRALALTAADTPIPEAGSTQEPQLITRPQPKQQARGAAWVLGSGLLWVALLLPTLGLAGSHGWTLLAADRYCYLPAAFVGAPLVAAFYDTFMMATIKATTSTAAAAAVVASSDMNSRKVANSWLTGTVHVVWPLVCFMIVLSLGGQLRLGQLPKWRSSNALWPRAALCRPTWGAACSAFADPLIGSVGTNSAVEMSNSSDVSVAGATMLQWFNRFQSGTGSPPRIVQLYACPDVIAVYNLGRRLQSIDRAGAAGVYLAAVRADSRHGGAWNNLGSLVEAGYGDPVPVLRAARAAMASFSSSSSSGTVDPEDSSVNVGGSSPAAAATRDTTTATAAEAAEACFRVAVSLHPRTHATAWNNLGRVLHKRAANSPAASHDGASAWVDAGTAYQKALGVSPTYTTAWFNFGLWYGAAANALGAIPAISPDFGMQVDGAFAFRRTAALAAQQGQASLQADALGKLGDLLLRTALDSHRAHAKQVKLKAQQEHAATCTDPSHDHSHSHHAHEHNVAPSEASPLAVLESAIVALQQLRTLRPGDSHSKSMLAFALAQRPKFEKAP